MKRFKAISSGILFFAMASQVAYLKFGDALEARFPLIKQLKANVAATRGPADPADVYALRPDGSAVDPKGYRKALMADRRALAAIGRESPEWKNVVERGTAAEFQDMLREGHRTRAAEEAARATAALREPDGSATHPEAYRELWTSDCRADSRPDSKCLRREFSRTNLQGTVSFRTSGNYEEPRTGQSQESWETGPIRRR